MPGEVAREVEGADGRYGFGKGVWSGRWGSNPRPSAWEVLSLLQASQSQFSSCFRPPQICKLVTIKRTCPTAGEGSTRSAHLNFVEGRHLKRDRSDSGSGPQRLCLIGRTRPPR